MDPKLAQVLPAVNGNVHYLHQSNDTLDHGTHNGLHTARSVVHQTHVLSHQMPHPLNTLA